MFSQLQESNRLLRYQFLLPLLLPYLTDGDVLCGVVVSHRSMIDRLIDYRVKSLTSQWFINMVLARSTQTSSNPNSRRASLTNAKITNDVNIQSANEIFNFVDQTFNQTINQTIKLRPNLIFTRIKHVSDLSSINKLYRSQSLISELVFDDNYNQSIEPCHSSNQSINQSFNNCIPTSVQHITFGQMFNNRGRPFDLALLPSTLASIKFGKHFNQPIINSFNKQDQAFHQSINRTIKSIEFASDGYFNHFIGPGVLPVSLTRLVFSPSFNNGDQSINQTINHLINLSELKFGERFVNVTEHDDLFQLDLTFGQSLTCLDLGGTPGLVYFDQLPPYITDLTLSCDVIDRGQQPDISSCNLSMNHPSLQIDQLINQSINQSINQTTSPLRIIEMTFGPWFDQTVSVGSISSTLQSLIFDNAFTNGGKPLQSDVLPSSLTHLQFGEGFSNGGRPIECGVLPVSLVRLKFGASFDNGGEPFAQGVLSRALKSLRMPGSDGIRLRDFSVEHLFLDGDFELCVNPDEGLVSQSDTRLDESSADHNTDSGDPSDVVSASSDHHINASLNISSTRLCKLTLSRNFHNRNQPFVSGSLPAITDLTIEMLDQPLVKGFISNSVKRLWIRSTVYDGSNFDQDVIPCSVELFALTNVLGGAYNEPSQQITGAFDKPSNLIKPGDLPVEVTHLSFDWRFDHSKLPLIPGAIPHRVRELVFGNSFMNGGQSFAEGVIPSSVRVITLPIKYLRQHPIEAHCPPSGCIVRHSRSSDVAMERDRDEIWWNTKPDFVTWPTDD